MTQSTDPLAPDYVAPQPPPDSMAPPSEAIAGGTPLDTQYTNYGTVMTEDQKKEAGNPEDKGPLGMPAAAASDAPFSETTIPGGWARFPTAEEVAYLNKLYPTE